MVAIQWLKNIQKNSGERNTISFQAIKPHVEAEEKQTENRTVTPPAAQKPKREENPQVSEHTQALF